MIFENYFEKNLSFLPERYKLNERRSIKFQIKLIEPFFLSLIFFSFNYFLKKL